MKRKTLDVWLATRRNGEQYIYKTKPEEIAIIWDSAINFFIGKNIFKQIWGDKPRKIEMILRDNL